MHKHAPSRSATLMTGQDYRESLRRYAPTVYVDGQRIDSVVDAPSLQPGINALAVLSSTTDPTCVVVIF